MKKKTISRVSLFALYWCRNELQWAEGWKETLFVDGKILNEHFLIYRLSKVLDTLFDRLSDKLSSRNRKWNELFERLIFCRMKIPVLNIYRVGVNWTVECRDMYVLWLHIFQIQLSLEGCIRRLLWQSIFIHLIWRRIIIVPVGGT